MHDYRHTGGLKTSTGEFRTLRTRRLWQLTAMHMGKTNTGLFEHRAIVECTGVPAAATRALPFIRAKRRLPVFIGQRRANASL